MRRGFSLPELALVLALIGTLLALALPHTLAWRDGWAVERAVRDMMAFYQAARFRAVASSHFVRVEIAPDTLRAILEGVDDSVVLTAPGPTRHGVALAASRPAIVLAPTGVGWGGANTKLVFTRGSAGDSLTTSRLGRLKRWR